MSKPRLNHQLLVRQGQALQYVSKNSLGICNGFTMGWIEAVLSNQYLLFNQYVALLATENIIPRILNVKERVKQKQSLSSDENTLLELLSFYERISLYQDPILHSDFFHHHLSQIDVESISQFAASMTIDAQGGLCKVYSQTGCYSLKNIKNHLTQLANMMDQLTYKGPIGFRLTSNNHTCGLVYEEKKWTFMDINKGLFKFQQKKSHIYFLAKKISQSFQLNQQKSRYTVLNTMGITTRKNPYLNELITVFKALKHQQIMTPVMMQGHHAFLLAVIATSHHDGDVIQKLLDQQPHLMDHRTERGLNLLHIAAYCGDERIVQMICHTNPWLINQQSSSGQTPLHLAVYRQHMSYITILLNHGANPMIPDQDGNHSGHYAEKINQVNLLYELILHGLNINLPHRINGFTLAHAAAAHGHTHILSLLAQQGAQLNQINYYGFSPLHVAIHHQQLDAILTLLQHHVLIDLLAHHNLHPLLDVAYKQGRYDIMNALLCRGVQPSPALLWDAREQQHHEVLRMLDYYRHHVRSQTMKVYHTVGFFSPITTFQPVTTKKAMRVQSHNPNQSIFTSKCT